MVVRVLLGTILLSGCSWLMVEGPPAHAPRDQPVDCTRTMTAPVFDTVVTSIAGTIVIGEIPLLASNNSSSQANDDAQLGLALFAILALVDGVSAVWGYQTVRECNELNQEIELERRVQKRTAAPIPAPVTPSPIPTPAPPAAPAVDQPDAGAS
jgi:hypothetical protein